MQNNWKGPSFSTRNQAHSYAAIKLALNCTGEIHTGLIIPAHHFSKRKIGTRLKIIRIDAGQGVNTTPQIYLAHRPQRQF